MSSDPAAAAMVGLDSAVPVVDNAIVELVQEKCLQEGLADMTDLLTSARGLLHAFAMLTNSAYLGLRSRARARDQPTAAAAATTGATTITSSSSSAGGSGRGIGEALHNSSANSSVNTLPSEIPNQIWAEALALVTPVINGMAAATAAAADLDPDPDPSTWGRGGALAGLKGLFPRAGPGGNDPGGRGLMQQQSSAHLTGNSSSSRRSSSIAATDHSPVQGQPVPPGAAAPAGDHQSVKRGSRAQLRGSVPGVTASEPGGCGQSNDGSHAAKSTAAAGSSASTRTDCGNGGSGGGVDNCDTAGTNPSSDFRQLVKKFCDCCFSGHSDQVANVRRFQQQTHTTARVPLRFSQAAAAAAQLSDAQSAL
jgi:hypothetical protein